MIIIVDGGSTKCDWVILDNAGNTIAKTQTIGMNPNMIEISQISNELNHNPELFNEKQKVEMLFFYGAGCGIEENQKKIQTSLQSFFTNAHIIVRDDLTAAAYSAYYGKPTMVGILGTGSNSCYFDGKEVIKKLPSLGFLIGDDGSGCALGKALIKNYFMKKLPTELYQDFTNTYQLSIQELIQKIYHSPKVNTYLASFNEFIYHHKEHPYIQHLIFEEFKNYFDYQILPYSESKHCEINFIGSIAFLYQDILKSAANECQLKVGEIIQKPIENLVNYHKNYILKG